MTVDEALGSFSFPTSPVKRALNVLHDVGLGYLRLGQSATELRAAKRSASNWQQNCNGLGGQIRFTFLMSRPQAYILRMFAGSWHNCKLVARATPYLWWSTTWMSLPRATGSSTSVRELEMKAAKWLLLAPLNKLRRTT